MSSRNRQLEDKISDQNLDLSCEGIIDIPVKEMAAYPRAVNVDLSNNHIRSLTVEFASFLVHIVQLDLSKNLIQKLPENFGLLVNLRHLDLYSNKIEKLPLSMSKLRKLRWLDLKDNPLVPSLKKIVGECWNAEQCYSCSKNVVAFMAHIEQQVGGGDHIGEDSSDQKQQFTNTKKRMSASSNDMRNGTSHRSAKVVPSAKLTEFSSDEEMESAVVSNNRDDDPVNQKKKRKRNMNKKASPVFQSVTEPIQNESPSGNTMENIIWLVRSLIWLVLFGVVFLLLCSLCLSSEGFNKVVVSVSSVESLNTFLSSQHNWIQTELLKTDRFTIVRDFGKDLLVLFANYFYTLVESVANSVGALTGGAIGK